MIAAAVAPTFFSSPIVPIVFLCLPLTFKVVNLWTTQGSALNRMARAGDHLMRLTSKVTIITASFALIFAVPSLSMKQAWAFARTFILLYSFVKDANMTAMYGASRLMRFEDAISMAN